MDKIVKKNKYEIIRGLCIDLVPVQPMYFDKIVALRNKETNRCFFNQESQLTIEQQSSWYEKYKLRDDDIYWCILDKNGTFIGTIRVYDISPNICEQGSFIIDDNYSKEAPYALEAELLSLKFCFEVLNINNIINKDRYDNKVMNSLSKKLGFQYIKTIQIREIDYNYYLLDREHFQSIVIEELLEYWVHR